MGIFKTPIVSKPAVAVAKAPEEVETVGETNYVDNLSNAKPVETVEPKPEPVNPAPVQAPVENYREVPVFLSQDKINDLIIENNLMLRQIMAHLD